MKDADPGSFCDWVHHKKRHAPLSGILELTYRCDLNCIHCVCKGNEERKRELDTDEWKKVLDDIRKEGCIWLTFTGGDPLIRKDFLELYAHAKKTGFLITIFTGGHAFTDKIIDSLAASPPEAVEITLNGITADVYECITQVKGSFRRTMRNIMTLFDNKIPIMIKTNCMKKNRHQIGKIKAFADELLGVSYRKRHYFRYDPVIYARLNGDRTPTNLRLTFEEIEDVKRQDKDIWEEYCEEMSSLKKKLKSGSRKDCLYHCNTWEDQFTIDPCGILKPCALMKKFGIDLKTTPFRRGFYEEFPRMIEEKFKTDSRCRNCKLQPLCGLCPPMTFLETGDEEAPISYYCELAEKTFRRTHGHSIVS